MSLTDLKPEWRTDEVHMGFVFPLANRLIAAREGVMAAKMVTLHYRCPHANFKNWVFVAAEVAGNPPTRDDDTGSSMDRRFDGSLFGAPDWLRTLVEANLPTEVADVELTHEPLRRAT